MTQVVLDTDVVSFLFKRHPIAFLYLPHFERQTGLISFMTVAELEQWALIYGWSTERRNRLETYLERFTEIPSSRDLCRRWAEVMVAARSVGRRIESPDAWIAATALEYDAPLATHNRRDYLGVPGLRIVSHA